MTSTCAAGDLLRRARDAAGLSQRELARRAGTSQSVVARIEGGRASPSLLTLERLVGAAGFDLRVDLVAPAGASSHMMDDVARILRLTPEERLLEAGRLSRFLTGARRV